MSVQQYSSTAVQQYSSTAAQQYISTAHSRTAAATALRERKREGDG
jgi:hypothetical protein